MYQTTDNRQRTTDFPLYLPNHSPLSTLYTLYTLSSLTSQLKRTMENKSPVWKQVIQIVITILTAITTTFGVQSCLGLNPSSFLAKFLPLSSFKSTHTYFQLTPNLFREKRRALRGQLTTDNGGGYACQRTTDNRQQTTVNSHHSQLSTLHSPLSTLIPNRYKYSLIPRKNPITREVVYPANLCAI